MPAIGYVTRSNGGYKGELKTLTITTPVEIVPNDGKTTDLQPDYRVVANGVEVGAGWNRVGEQSGKEYVSLSLAAPEFGPRRLYANMGRAAGKGEDDFAIIWNPAD